MTNTFTGLTGWVDTVLLRRQVRPVPVRVPRAHDLEALLVEVLVEVVTLLALVGDVVEEVDRGAFLVEDHQVAVGGGHGRVDAGNP